MLFKLHSNYNPSGDQPQAIDILTNGIMAGLKHQTLIGATGTGKTFTMANIIKNVNKPTLILSHNKTLAAQLFSEFREFFPENAVEYFVSYYDYYQPEAYVPSKDLYIEKDSDINDLIEKYRNSATQQLLSRRDVVIVSTVSCIYGLGDPEDYSALSIVLKAGKDFTRDRLMGRLRDMQYERVNLDFAPGTYRVRGDNVDLYLTTSDDRAIRFEFFGEDLERIKIINPLTGEVYETVEEIRVFPSKHFVSPQEKVNRAMANIREDMEKEVAEFEKREKIIEATRLRQRVNYDLEMIQETGFVKGIENYSRYIDNRPAGTAPSTLLDYFPEDYLMFVDESHITIPQVRGMYFGDLSRKQNLVDYGFRLRAALDNRPLKFDEFISRTNQTIYTTATPKEYEVELSKKAAEETRNERRDLFSGKELEY